METAIEVSENIGSFSQMVRAFRPDEFLLTFFMDLETNDNSASEWVGQNSRWEEGMKRGGGGERKMDECFMKYS